MTDADGHHMKLLVHVLLSAGALGLMVWLTRETLKKEVRSPGCWFGMLYCFGGVLCILGLLPDPELERVASDADVPLQSALLPVGLGMILIGWITHAILRRQGRLRDRKDERAWLLAAAVVAVAGVAMMVLRRRGLQHLEMYFVVGLGALLVALLGAWFLGQYLIVRKLPVNRLARLVRAGRHAEAIRVGEALSADERTPEVDVNLGAAYWAAGCRGRARALFEALRARPDLSAPIRAAVDDWLARASSATDEREGQA